MTLEIISAHDILFSGKAESVMLPGELGRFTVLKNHAPLISVLVKGTVYFRTEGGEERSIPVEGGIADVNDNVVSVCVY